MKSKTFGSYMGRSFELLDRLTGSTYRVRFLGDEVYGHLDISSSYVEIYTGGPLTCEEGVKRTMRAEVELTHDDVIKAIKRYVISEFPTVVPIEEVRVNIQINNIYADNALYDSTYSAKVTFGMSKVKPLGGND